MFEWYQENYFRANADKYHLLLSLFSNKEIAIASYNIASSNSEKLLGVVIGNEVTFMQNILKTSTGRLIKNSMQWRE